MKFAELVNALENIGVDSADSEAELILSHLFGASRASIVFDREKEYDAGSSHLVLLVKNKTGWDNLIYLVSKAYTDGFYSNIVAYGLMDIE